MTNPNLIYIFLKTIYIYLNKIDQNNIFVYIIHIHTHRTMPNSTTSNTPSLYQVFMEIDGNFFASEYMPRKHASALYHTLVGRYGDTTNISFHKSKPVHEHEAGFTHTDEDYEAAETLTNMSSHSAHPLHGLHIEHYGNGYIVYPKLNHPDYGAKYYHNGWWNASAKGWFFKTSEYENLVALGAISIPDVPTHSTSHSTQPFVVEDDYNSQDDEDYVDADFSSMVYMKYGKGYLMKPHRKHEHYGEKYYHNGFWNASAKGWFFKKEYKNFLSEHGATFLHNAGKGTSR